MTTAEIKIFKSMSAGGLLLQLNFKRYYLTFMRPQCLFLPVHTDTKNRYKIYFLTIKQYLISISPLTVKRNCLNFILLKR